MVRAVDDFQQRHTITAFVFALVKKAGDDRLSALAVLLTYNGFLATLPLLLVATTVLGYVFAHHPALEQSLIHSALSRFPVIGSQLGANVHPLRGNTFGLVVGVAGLVWGSLGVAQAGQLAMNEVWNIPGVVRPGFFPRMIRSFTLLGVVGVGVIVSAVSTSLAGMGGKSALVRVIAGIVATVLNLGLYIAAFRVLTVKRVPTRRLLPGALAGGLAWSALLAAGAFLVGHELRHASQLYGLFASVLGLLWWLYLSAEIALYAAELNVVLDRHLWPRSIVQPPLTPADKQALEGIAQREERRPEESVQISFRDPPN